MPSSAPRSMITTSRLSVGAEANAKVARPILKLVASPSKAVRRVTPRVGSGTSPDHRTWHGYRAC